LRNRDSDVRRPIGRRRQQVAYRPGRRRRIEDLVELSELRETDPRLELHQHLPDERVVVDPRQPGLRRRELDPPHVLAQGCPYVARVVREVDFHHPAQLLG
jgi:hypothetical protein